MAKLGEDFFERDTLTVAQELLGKYLVRSLPEGLSVLRITETEGYVGRMDKACHAYGYRRTKRTETLFARAGTVYIYLIYGMYHCLNFVTEPEGEPCAVLIRGGLPVVGEEEMAQRRFRTGALALRPARRRSLLNGPGKLCSALDLTRAQNGLLLPHETVFVCDEAADFGLLDYRPPEMGPVQSGERIGIGYAEEAVHFPWRFWV